MSIYNAYVKTCHGVRCYQVAAFCEGAARREAETYGYVQLVYRVCACQQHKG